MADQASGLKKPQNLSPELQAVVGTAGPMPRTEVVRGVWDYIKANNLQKPEDKRIVKTDDKLKKIFDNQDEVGMLKIAGLLSKHLTPAA